MPTHPTTYLKDKINHKPTETQVRYWSICTSGAIANPPILPADSACLFDQEVPTNSNGEYTVVVSLPQDRPKNAKPGCGVAWLDWEALATSWKAHMKLSADRAWTCS